MPDSVDNNTELATSDHDSVGHEASTNRRRRKRWFRLVSVLIAVVPFLLLEIGLRIAGLPATVEGVDEDPVVDMSQLQPLFELDSKLQEYFIPERRMNFFRPAVFSATKGPDVKRIFVLGGSTVQGRPFAVETAFSTWFQIAMQAANQNVRFEVVNCGGASYASYRVARILDEVLEYEPDAIVIYTGHNEFLEDRSYAGVRDLTRARRWASRIATKVRTVRWIKSLMGPPRSNARTQISTEVAARLDRAGGLDSYQRNTEWKARVEEHFRFSLQRMIQRVQTAGVPLVLCVPASDVLNTPPFKTEVDPRLGPAQRDEWRQLTKSVQTSDHDLQSQEPLIRRILELDPHDARANYLLGRAFMERQQYRQAGRRLAAAREYDVCPLRATEPIVSAVRELAESHSVPLLDTPRLLDRRQLSGVAGSDGLADAEWFADHLHPTVAGHQLIGEELAKFFEQLGWVEFTDEARQVYEARSLVHLAQLEESYFHRGKQRLRALREWAAGRVGRIEDPENTIRSNQ